MGSKAVATSTAGPSRGDPDDAGRSGGARPRAGWALLALLTLLVLASWTPSLTAALGDNHEGRILARHALNVQNAQDDGLVASGWLSDWSPYVGGDGGESYAHHPPLMNLGYYLAGQLLPLDLDTAMRAFAYLTGVAALPLGAVLLRRLGLGWPAVLVATTALATTPLFWVYGRLNGSVSLLLAMTLTVVRLGEDRDPGPTELTVAGLVTFAAIVAGYLGLATAALLGLWLLRRRGLDRVTLLTGAVMVLGAVVSLAYVVGGSGGGEIGSQLQMRTAGGGFTAGEFLGRLGDWTRELLPGVWRWLALPAGVAAALVDRRTRAIGALLALVAAAYVFGLPNGSYIHDYWIFPALLPMWLGLAVLAERAIRLAPRHRRTAAGAVLAALVAAGGTAALLSADVPERYLHEPEQAGELARSITPAERQSAAWRTAGLAAPRWLSYYWGLSPAHVGADDRDRPGDGDRVFVALEHVPGWLGDASRVADVAVDVRGRYAVVTGAELRAGP